MSDKIDSAELLSWEQLTVTRQTELRIEYGHYLDTLPATCSLETKIERFRTWLEARGIKHGG